MKSFLNRHHALTVTLVLLVAFASSAAGVEVSGEQSGRWAAANSPYIVTGNVIIPSGMTLTIESGVVVKFAGFYSLQVNGALRVLGTPASRVVFTSIHDDEYGRTETTAARSPLKADWQGLEFIEGSDGEQSRLENCLIKYCAKPLAVRQNVSRRFESITILDCGDNFVTINGKQVFFQNGVERDYETAGANSVLTSFAPANLAPEKPASLTPPTSGSAALPRQDKTKDKPGVLVKEEFSFGELTVVTASKRQQRLSEAPAIIDVITAEEIRSMGAQTLEEVVMFLTSIQTPMSRKGYTHFWVRGLGGSYNNKSLLLIDGYPSRPLWFAHHPLDEELPLNNVERIELMRGPGSALYGANALVGVINLITKNPSESAKSHFSISRGNKETQKMNFAFGQSSDLGSVSGSLTYFDTQGDFINLDRYAHQNLKYDARNTIDMSGRARIGEFTLGAFYNNYTTQYRTQEYNEDLHYDKKAYGLNLEFNHPLSNTVGFLSRNYYNRFPWADRGSIYSDIITETSSTNIKNRLDVDIERRIDAEVIGTDLQLTWQSSGKNVLIAGLNFEREKLKDFYEIARFNWYEDNIIFNNKSERDEFADDYGSDYDISFASRDVYVDGNGDGVVDDTLYVLTPQLSGSYNEYATQPLPILNTNVAFYLQDTWQIHPQADLIAGFRYDNHEVYGSSFSPRSGLIWRASPRFTTKLLYNRAFRAPAYFELYLGRADNDNPGNLNLKPEHIQALDVEFNAQLSSTVSAKLGFFHEQISDFIRSVDTDTIRNIGSRRARGVELGLNYRLNKNTYAFANLSFMDVKDLAAPEFSLVWETPQADKSKYSLEPTGRSMDIEVPNIAPVLANIGVNFGQYKYANINLVAHYEGKRNRPLDYHAGIRAKYGKTRYFLEDNLGAYVVTNLTLVSKNFLAPWEFSLAVKNLFDTKYYSPGHEPAKYYDVQRDKRRILFQVGYQF